MTRMLCGEAISARSQSRIPRRDATSVDEDARLDVGRAVPDDDVRAARDHERPCMERVSSDVRQRDRLERYLAWYDKYLKPARTSTSAQPQH